MLAGRVRTCLANTRVGVSKMWFEYAFPWAFTSD